MNDFKIDAATTRPSRLWRRVVFLGLALTAIAGPRALGADDDSAPRPLPPVSAIYPGSLAQDNEQPQEWNGDVVYPETAASQAAGSLAPDAPPIRLLSAQAPVDSYYRDEPVPHMAKLEPAVPADPLETTPFADEPEKPAAQGEQSDSQAPAEAKQGEEPQKLGQAPVSSSLQFLRTQDVLLDPGQWQADTGFAYTLFENQFPVPLFDGGGTIVDVVEGNIRDRLIYTPLAFRYGWSDNIQLFGVLPTGFAATQLSRIGESFDQNTGGIGDLTAGANMHLIKGEETLPDVIGTLAFTAPTGDFNAPVFGVIPGTALGQGFWAFSAQLLFINRYDPIIAYYGVGIRHLFEREFNGVLFQPGEQFNYQFGIGFAVNDRVTLSAAFQGFYITDTLLDRTALAGTNVEPLSLRFAATIARRGRIIEPFALIGMTPSAPAASIGVTVTFYSKDDCE